MINLKKYENIIFDFGGVILDINPDLSKKAFIKLYGIREVEKVYSSNLLVKFENGLLTLNELINEIELLINKPINKADFIKAWNTMLLQYKPERIEWIKKLKLTHNLIMLSNTNDVHFNYFSDKLLREYAVTFYDLFNNVYLSHEMKLIKPDIKIFKKVIEDTKINPEKTLFIEDTKENTIVANSLGINTLLIDRNSNFYDNFTSF